MPNLTKYRKATLTIDGQPVPIQVRRLTLEQAEAFRSFLSPFLKDREDRVLTPDEAGVVRASIENYLTVPPGALSVDDAPVVTGAQLLEVIGENPAVVMRALLAIAGVSTVSSAEGNASASESASAPSSDAPAPAVDGRRPAPIAGSAEPAATARSAAATAATGQPLSGPTGTLN